MKVPATITSVCLGEFRSNHIFMIYDDISHMMKYFTSYFLQQSCGCFRQISTFKLFSTHEKYRIVAPRLEQDELHLRGKPVCVEGAERGGFCYSKKLFVEFGVLGVKNL